MYIIHVYEEIYNIYRTTLLYKVYISSQLNTSQLR